MSACLAASLAVAGEGASACVTTYTTVLKASKAPQVLPAEVPDLYKAWCKKNMKVSSAKSMDELCAPMVSKIKDKMLWVPADAEVTPEMACDSVEKLKERFPEHMAIAEAKLKDTASDEAARKALLAKAKELKEKLSVEVRDVVGTWGASLVSELGERLKSKASEVLGPDSPVGPQEALVKTLVEAAGLSSRGIETKLLQKLEESVGGWASKAAKEAAKSHKAAEL